MKTNYMLLKRKKINNPLITRIHSIIDGRYRGCHNNYFHTIKYVCIYDTKHKNITHNETINLTISDKSMNLCEINKK